MDEAAVRQHAEAHASANASGDLKRAATDLSEEALANIGPVARQLPRPITEGTVTRVETAGEGRYVATILYSGPDASVTVESVWVEQGGRPMIAETRIV